MFKWQHGSQLSVAAAVAGQEMERIASEQGGELCPEDVVAESQAATAPLHPCFTWDDRLAAEERRLDQARYLLRSIVVVSEDGSEYRGFVNVRRRDEDGQANTVYVRTVEAVANADYRAQILQTALREQESWRRRYGEYAELARIVTAIEETRQALMVSA